WSLLVDEPSQIINIGGVNRTLLSDATIVQNPGFRQLSFGFNMDSSRATSDAGLRSALAVTLNPILYRQLYPSTIISHSPVIQEDVPWYNPAVPTYQVTITPVGTPPRSTALLTQSLQLLDNAGYVDRDGDGFRERPNGAPLALTVVGIPVAEDTRMRTMTPGFFIPVLHFNAIEAAVRGSFDGWVDIPGGVNNSWTYQMLHYTPPGPLAASFIVIPTAVKAGQLTTAIAKVIDSEGAPVSGASVSFWIGGSQVGSGTTDLAGNVSAAVIAPSAQGATDVQVTIQVSKLGYAGATTSA